MSASVNQGYYKLNFSPEAFTAEHYKAHKDEFFQMITAVVIALIAEVYDAHDPELSKITDKQVSLLSNKAKLAMGELKPAMEVAKKLTKDQMTPYADWTKLIKSTIEKNQPEIYSALCDQRIQKLSNIKADHLILGNLIKFTRLTNENE